jgi:formylglycine-generating enzyme required for sulfatase activity
VEGRFGAKDSALIHPTQGNFKLYERIMTITSSQRKKVFISYSHNDAEWLKRLQIHLKPLEREGALELWSDDKIQPGSKWREEIRAALEQAKVAVLLVSANFLASEFIVKNELPPLLAAAEEEDAVILPVIVSPCRFEKTQSLSKFQAVNSPRKTLLQMSEAEREEIFVKVADAIESVLERGNEKPVAHTIGSPLPLVEKEVYTPTSISKNKSRLIWLLPSIIMPFVIGGVIATIFWPRNNHPIVPVSPVGRESYETKKTSISTKVKQDMVHIPGGYFDMGSSDGEDEYVHQVYVNDFYMGKHEVTVGEFREFMRETDHRTNAEKGSGSHIWDGKEWGLKKDASWLNSYFKQSDNYPVVCVSWNDAVAYCNWRSQKEGLTPIYTINDNVVSADFNAKGYRLPTEAEWEYAARCGGKGYKYSWGDGGPVGKHGGNIADEAAKRTFSNWEIWKGYDDGYVYTAPVGSFDPNEFGLYDMTGNVWERCWDWYDKEYYKNSPKKNPQGPSSGNSRVARGGAWYNSPIGVRAASRSSGSPAYSNDIIGFRLSRTF